MFLAILLKISLLRKTETQCLMLCWSPVFSYIFTKKKGLYALGSIYGHINTYLDNLLLLFLYIAHLKHNLKAVNE